MSEATETPEKKKRTRTPRPYWVLLPVMGTQTFEVHVCPGKPAVRKLLKNLEIDAADPRSGGIKVLRADEVPFNWEPQTIFKFGKSTDDETEEEET